MGCFQLDFLTHSLALREVELSSKGVRCPGVGVGIYAHFICALNVKMDCCLEILIGEI